jgi:anti-sigma-K factor RskA
MTADHDLHPHDDLAIYALDALDPADHAALEAHLAGCAACRAELDEHRETLARLVVPAEEPPPSVWSGIAQQLPRSGGPSAPSTPLPGADEVTGRGPVADTHDTHADDDHPDDDGTTPVVPLHAPLHARRRTMADRAGWLAAAAALVVVVGLGALLVTRDTDGSGAGSGTVADLAAAAVDAPGSTVVALRSDGGDEVARVVLAGEAGGTDYVIFDDLARLPAGRSYQLWKTAGAAPPVSLGVLGDGSGEAVAIAAPADVRQLALSEEPDTGVPAPTGRIVATGQRV